MVLAVIGKCARFGKSELKSGTGIQIPAIEATIIGGHRMGLIVFIRPNYGCSHRNRDLLGVES
jgi:hypothetical protein